MMKALGMTKKEIAKVTHDINNVWHARYEGLRFCAIQTHTNKADSPSYEYVFINHGFGAYEFIDKRPTADRR